MDVTRLRWCEFSCLILLCVLPATSKASWMWLGIASLGAVHQPTDIAPPASSNSSPAQVQPTPGQSVCSLVPDLANEQRVVCEQRPDAIPVIGAGARLGIFECQRQFRDERWNCTIHDQEQNAFGKVLKTGSRETAFVYAITSAGVVHAVTRTCSTGNLTDCSCDESRNGIVSPDGWQWGGCSDNLDYGIRIGRQFVDAAEVEREEEEEEGRGSRVRSAMNLHNNEVGRQVIQQFMARQCRCHGVSGSCTIKSCWNTMPNFLAVGDYLKKRYLQSVEILNRPTKRRLRRKDKAVRRVPITADEMVHLERSPNYCVQDPSKGILGTSGRECNRTSVGADSCDLLCCGRGYNTQEVRIVERCDCKFIWCCEVKCRVCETITDLYTCK